jgi:ERCC4-type nuclease
MGESPKI